MENSKMFKLYLVIILMCQIAGSSIGVHAYRYSSMKKSRCLNPPRTARRVENVIKDCQEDVKNKLLSEAYELLKLEANEAAGTTYVHDEAFEFIEHGDSNHNDQRQLSNDSFHALPIPSTSSSSAASSAATSSLPNPYEYLIFKADSGEPIRRMSRLLHRIRRVSDVSDGIYHPTLVPQEDKRIAGCLLHCVYAKNNAIDKFGWPTLDGLVDFYSEGVNEHGFFMATLRSVNLCLRAATNKYHVNRRKLPAQGESCDLAFDVFDCISDQITGYCLAQFTQR